MYMLRTVRTVPWIDEEFKNCMFERVGAKGVANKSGCTSGWLFYCKLRNDVTKLNKNNTFYYEAKINDIKNDGKTHHDRKAVQVLNFVKLVWERWKNWYRSIMTNPLALTT